MRMTPKIAARAVRDLNRAIAAACALAEPPETLTVSEWADLYRRLSPENSAEAGPWKTSRTPYMKEIMDAFTDPKIRRISVVASSQVGKSEMLLNMIGYIIDNDPGGIMFVQPTGIIAEDFSKRRLSPMLRDTPRLRRKVSDIKAKSSNNTVLKKSYPGGMMTITGSNSPAELAGRQQYRCGKRFRDNTVCFNKAPCYRLDNDKSRIRGYNNFKQSGGEYGVVEYCLDRCKGRQSRYARHQNRREYRRGGNYNRFCQTKADIRLLIDLPGDHSVRQGGHDW